jgi:hypothetical protein
VNRRILTLLMVVIHSCFCLPLAARENPYSNSPEILSARTAAIGGLHSALADDLISLFSNPAGFRSADPQLSAAEVTVSVYAPPDGGVFSSTPSSYAAIQLLGPISFGYVGNGLGFGIFDTLSIRYGVDGGTDTAIDENIILSCGYAFRIPFPEGSNSTLDLGLLGKGFVTTRSTTSKSIGEILGSYLDITDVSSYRDGAVERVAGFGLDLGILYSYKDTLSVGLVARNAAFGKRKSYTTFQDFLNGDASSAGYTFYAVDLSFGVAWKPQLERLTRHFQDLTLMLDYRDILDFLVWESTAIHPLLHISLGVEFRLLEILSIRAGFYQCLPSAGIGLDLTLFTLNATISGLELSDRPWGSPIYNTMFGLEFRY